MFIKPGDNERGPFFVEDGIDAFHCVYNDSYAYDMEGEKPHLLKPLPHKAVIEMCHSGYHSCPTFPDLSIYSDVFQENARVYLVKSYGIVLAPNRDIGKILSTNRVPVYNLTDSICLDNETRRVHRNMFLILYDKINKTLHKVESTLGMDLSLVYNRRPPFLKEVADITPSKSTGDCMISRYVATLGGILSTQITHILVEAFKASKRSVDRSKDFPTIQEFAEALVVADMIRAMDSMKTFEVVNLFVDYSRRCGKILELLDVPEDEINVIDLTVDLPSLKVQMTTDTLFSLIETDGQGRLVYTSYFLKSVQNIERDYNRKLPHTPAVVINYMGQYSKAREMLLSEIEKRGIPKEEIFFQREFPSTRQRKEV